VSRRRRRAQTTWLKVVPRLAWTTIFRPDLQDAPRDKDAVLRAFVAADGGTVG
jgi:hypothetical protein